MPGSDRSPNGGTTSVSSAGYPDGTEPVPPPPAARFRIRSKTLLPLLFLPVAAFGQDKEFRGDFWLDAPLHFRVAGDPRQVPPFNPTVKNGDETPRDEAAEAVVAPDYARKAAGDSSVKVTLSEGSVSLLLTPAYQDDWKMGPDWRVQFDVAVDAGASCTFQLFDRTGHMAQSRQLTWPAGGSWQKVELPFSELEVPKDFAFDQISHAALVFGRDYPQQLWLDGVRFASESGKEEIALTDQLTRNRMAEEKATRARRVAETYALARGASGGNDEGGSGIKSKAGNLFQIFSKLQRNQDVEETNRQLLEILRSKDPAVRAQYGFEYTWALTATPNLYRLYFNFGSKSKTPRLTPEVEKEILALLWERTKEKNDIHFARQSTWYLTGSENHDINAKVSSILSSQIFRHEPDYADRIYPDPGTGGGSGYWFHRTVETGRFHGAEGRAKKTETKKYNARDHYDAWVEFLKEYFRERARHGFFVEKASPNYMGHTMAFIQDLYNYIEDAELKRITRLFLDMFWAEWAQDQLAGVRGGGKTRVNKPIPFGRADNMYQMASFFFGGLGNPNSELNGFWITDYSPPEVVWNLALNRETLGSFAYVSRTPGEEPGKLPRPFGLERTLDCDTESRLLRYSWVTPDYVLGSQMDYPLAVHSHLSPAARWHGIIFSTSPDAMVFPRALKETKDGGWAPLGKGAPYRCVQDGPVLISQQTLGFTIVNPEWFPGGQGQESFPYGIYLSPGLDQVEEEQGWVFVKEGNAYLAIRVLSGNFQASVDTSTDTSPYQGSPELEEPIAAEPFAWNADQTIMRFKDRHAPVLFEAGRRADFPTLADFKKHIFGNKLVLEKIAVPGYYTIHYESGGKKYYFNAANGELPYVNDRPIDYAPKLTFQSPYMKGNYGEGVIQVTDGRNKVTLDFEKGKRKP